MAHYFDASVKTPSNPFTFQVTCLNVGFTFHSDHGVFAKEGLDFASRLLIENVTLSPDDTCLDLGCGIGVIGLILAKVNGVKMTCSDVNERALALTQKNAENLQLDVNVVNSDGFSTLHETFDQIISNPPIRIGKPALYALLKAALDHLNPGGSLWVVMHKKHGVESLIQSFQSVARIETVTRKKGFKVLRLTQAVDDLTVM